MEEYSVQFMQKFVWNEPQRSQLASLLQLDELPPEGLASSNIVATIVNLAVSRLEDIFASYVASDLYNSWRRQARSPLNMLQAKRLVVTQE